MEQSSVVADHPKKRRRRRLSRPPIPAWVKLSEDLKGEVGRISDDLYTSLFRYESIPKEISPRASGVRYVAITSWTSRSEDPVGDEFWTILPVVAPDTVDSKAAKLPPFTIIFSTTSPSLRNFVEILQSSVVAGNINGKSGFEALITDVEPLELHSIILEIDGTALTRHHEVQRKFGGGFSTGKNNGISGKGKGKGKEKAQSAERVGSATPKSSTETQGETLMIAIRQALGMRSVIRQDDLLPIPLPAHPITHVSFPPAKIAFVEPVSQGIMASSTQIIVKQVYRTAQRDQSSSASTEPHPLREPIAEPEDDPATDQFFSAVENRDVISNQSSISGEESSDSSSSNPDSGAISEDSSEDIISMTAPPVRTNFHGANSSLTADTPRGPKSPRGLPQKLNGINSPGSIYSNFTSTTVRQGSVHGRGLFQAQPLLGKISESLLHPKPLSDEDEEARVFIDVKMLLKLGCFSGDWVKIDIAMGPSFIRRDFCDDEVGEDDEFVGNFRAAKIYGLPDLSPKHRFQYLRSSAAGRPASSNGSAYHNKSIQRAWFSPILLANLGSPTFVRLSPVKGTSSEPGFGPQAAKTQSSSSFSPPIAKEVTLVKISTPLSTELALQASLFTALKRYFEAKRRILRQGDIVPLTIDTTIGRILAQSSGASTMDKGTEEKLLMDLTKQNHQPKTLGICWFRVEQVIGSEVEQGSKFSETDSWGCWACMEPMTTCVLQAGTETSRILSTVNSSWEYYLGAKPRPKNEIAPNNWIKLWKPASKLHVTSLGQRLRELIQAGISPEAAQHGVGPMFVLMRSTQRHTGKATLVLRACSDLGVHVFPIDAPTLLADSGAGGADIKTEITFRAQIERALSCNPETTIILIRHVEALGGDRMTSVLKEVATNFSVLVATTTQVESVSEDLRSLFTHELELSAPDETEREGILRTIIDERSIRLSHDVDLSAIAIKTAALVAGDLVDVVERAMIAREHRLERLTVQGSNLKQSSAPILVRDILVSGGENARCVTKPDFDLAVDAARKNFADSIGAPKIPNVSWEDVGGLENVKSAVMETIQLPLERPELFAKGMKKRSGILFYGPPGTGKTLLAKAIATEFSLNFFSVKGPELLNMYIGESEANVRRVFQRARDARPCVVFFDELDSVAPKRGNQGDSGGVMDRIVSQLLAELDGMSGGDAEGGGVFVIGATNRPDLLDPALLRPGRFDKMLYLGVSDTHDKQLRILEALTRKFRLGPDVSLRRVAESMPFTYTGADLYAICSDAMLKAITRQCAAVDSRIKGLYAGDGNRTVTPAYFFDHLATAEDIEVTVREQDFISAMRELVGSVSAKELEHYQQVRRSFEGADAPKTTNSQSQHHDAIPTRIPAPVGALAPPISKQIPKRNSNPNSNPNPNLNPSPKLKSKSHPTKSQSKIKSTDKGKGKGKGKAKGKAKATVWDSRDDSEEDDDDSESKSSHEDEDEAYLTSHDFDEEQEEDGDGGGGATVPGRATRGKYGVYSNANGGAM